MSTTRKLRLGPLPKTESSKLTFACPASLKNDLDRNAAVLQHCDLWLTSYLRKPITKYRSPTRGSICAC